MDDNTTQIQMAENVASDASIESLFKLFRQYQSKGTICATLGSFEFYKPITRPLEATEIEDIEERLGSKIMYIDYKRLSQKLKTEKKQLHETVSPCSLWWGEDYFNMLAILKLMENEEQSGLLGVVPYSVAWHKRSHNQQNKAKSTPHFKLANIWLSIDETYLKSLTPHQQQIIRFMQSLVKKAIDEQNARQTKYLATLESQQSNESEKEDQAKPYDLGYHRGVKIATYGCPLDIEKIKHALKSDKSVKPGTEDEYIKGFSEGHQSIWVTLDEASQAYHRGYHDGYLAAKQGFKSDKLKLSNLPATIQEQREYYIEGFKKANLRQWDKMRAATNQDEIQAFAKTMGAALAKTPFAINEAKLWKLSTEFGDNDACFAAAYRAAFNAEKSVKSVPVLPQYNSYKEVATENGVSSTNSADLRAAKIRL
jgi:hypothetical protein